MPADAISEEDVPVGGTYTVTLTFTDAPRAAVENMIEDITRNGDFPADDCELEVVEETADEKWHY
jgi:hypothetical protein